MDYNLFASNYRPQDGSSSTNLNATFSPELTPGRAYRSDYQLNNTDSEDSHEQSGGISRTYPFSSITAIRL